MFLFIFIGKQNYIDNLMYNLRLKEEVNGKR